MLSVCLRPETPEQEPATSEHSELLLRQCQAEEPMAYGQSLSTILFTQSELALFPNFSHAPAQFVSFCRALQLGVSLPRTLICLFFLQQKSAHLKFITSQDVENWADEYLS